MIIVEAPAQSLSRKAAGSCQSSSLGTAAAVIGLRRSETVAISCKSFPRTTRFETLPGVATQRRSNTRTTLRIPARRRCSILQIFPQVAFPVVLCLHYEMRCSLSPSARCVASGAGAFLCREHVIASAHLLPEHSAQLAPGLHAAGLLYASM